MDTKPLERFAAEARRELLTAVDAQTSAVLAAGSVARSERAETVKRLEAEIAKHGRKHVIDKVAYTWFNRLIALRYMDVHGYTSAGVVSPAQGHEHGQPEILADAKSGHLDTEVITTPRVQEAIMGLLDGTRRSTDPEGEAYALLLTEFCRHWNKAMPFMFEREGDYTELLVPAGLLADGGILSRARSVLTKDLCEDVEVIGWLYQFYISERKNEVFAGFSQNKKAGADEIPAATQLFTPHWIVRYLVENSLGRLWMLNRPESRIVDQMGYYIAPVDEETDFLKISGPEDLTLIDPACGSGHMLTYAFDLLYAIYEEEGYAPSDIPALILSHNLHGTEIDPRAGSLAAFALTMKARAKDRRFFTRNAEPKICVIEPIAFESDELDFLLAHDGDRYEEQMFWNQFRDADTLGSLIQPGPDATKHAEVVLSTINDGLFYGRTLERARQVVQQAKALSQKYSVVTANPPYMGSRNFSASLKANLDRILPDGKSDLYSAFLVRGLDLVTSSGVLAMVTMQSWMFLKSYDELRERLLDEGRLSSMLHLGTRAFDAIGGEVVSTTAFAITKGRGEARGTFIRLVDLNSEMAKSVAAREAIQLGLESSRISQVSGADLRHLPGNIIAYWLPATWRDLFAECEAVREIAEPRKGLDTAFNDRFLRYWWEVGAARSNYDSEDSQSAQASGARWFPYNKGGESRKWYGNHWFVVNWANNGTEIRKFGTESGGKPRSAVRNAGYYFSPSISWSDIGGLAFRSYPAGFIHDNKGPSVFSKDAEVFASLLAYLNSPLAAELLMAIAPTMSTQIGDVAILPAKMKSIFGELTDSLVQRARTDWDSFETSWNFAAQLQVEGAPARADVLPDVTRRLLAAWNETGEAQQADETRANERVADLYGVTGEIPAEVPLERVALSRNPAFVCGAGLSEHEYLERVASEWIKELVSYAVGCMFGRYSLDEPGLILADQGATLQDYLAKVPSPTFMPDADNVIPIVDDGWFEDDIVERFRQFLRSAFGAEHFEENLRFVEESLGVKSIRDYFIAKANPSGKIIARSRFYEDHIQRYKRRPIYWMFSSPKGSFNALIYMHRYTPSTVSTVLNEYLREYRAKLEVALQRAEEAAAGGASTKEQKEAERLRKVLAELRDYEHYVLYPLDIQKIDIDLDDGVLVNYLRLGSALRDGGLEKDRTKVESWTWPKNRLESRK